MTEARINIVTMPKWGLAMQEGTITEWYKAEGDEIAEGEPICDIETTKITNEFEAPFGGTIARLLAPVGSNVEVGVPIAVIVNGEVAGEEIDRAIEARAGTVSVTDYEAAGSPVRMVEVGDGHLAVLETGPSDSETAVVFLHGFGGGLDNWGLLQGEVPSAVRTVALDLPGHGQSDKLVGDGSPSALAERVSALLDALGIAHAHLVAHSFGAAIALEFAARRPDRIASLLLIAPAALGAKINRNYVVSFMKAERKRDMRPVLEMLFSNPEMLGRTMVTDALSLLRDEEFRQALSRLADGLLGSDRDEAGADSAVLDRHPSVVVWGDADAVARMPSDLGGRLGKRLKIVAGAGHMPHAERPREVAGLLRDQIA